MHLYAYQRAKMGDQATEKAVSERIGITPETISRWKSIKGFAEWLEGEIAKYRTPILEMLEQVAVHNLNDFRFWEVMAKKYGYTTDAGASDTDKDKRVFELAYRLQGKPKEGNA